MLHYPSEFLFASCIPANAPRPPFAATHPPLPHPCSFSQSVLNKGTHLLKALIFSPRSLSRINLPKPQSTFSL